MKIAVLTSSFDSECSSFSQAVKKRLLEVIFNRHGRKASKDEIVQLAGDASGVIAGLEKYDVEVLNKLPKLRVISRVGVGVDSIDLEFCKNRNIQVFTTADAVIEPVAELTVGLILNLLRQIEIQSVELKAGDWKRRGGNLLQGKTIGIVGLGRIGRRVSEFLRPFHCRMIAADIKPFDCPAVEQVSFDKLIHESDIVTLHCNSELNGKPIMTRSAFERMKKGSKFINVARGNLVDESALGDALQSGHLSGAALDVFQMEPYKGPLMKVPNIILTPHIGSFAAESRAQMEAEALDNLLKGLECK